MALIITVLLVVLLLGSIVYMVSVDPDAHQKPELSFERRAQIMRGLREKRKRKKK